MAKSLAKGFSKIVIFFIRGNGDNDRKLIYYVLKVSQLLP